MQQIQTKSTVPPPLERVAGLIEKQVAESHGWVLSLFQYAADEERDLPIHLKIAVVQAAMRLMQANASAASAMQRLHGTRHAVAEDSPPAKNDKRMGTSDA